jgi:hypothetical protein
LTKCVAIYFLFLLQLTAYSTVAIAILFVKIYQTRRPKQQTDEGYTIFQRVVIGIRLLISGSFSAVGMICAAEALMLYNNLNVLAFLPVRRR